MTTRTTSLNIPSVSNPVPAVFNPLPAPRTFPAPFKSFITRRAAKNSKAYSHLQIRALSVFEHAPMTTMTNISGLSPLPRGPPPSPKTPTQDLSIISPSSLAFGPLRAVPIIPRTKYPIDHDPSPLDRATHKKADYQDHAREYLSASDCSDSDHDDEIEAEKKRIKQAQTIVKPKLTFRTQSFSRPDTATRDRVFAHHANHYLSLAEVYYSSLDIYKNIAAKSRRRLRSQTRSTLPNNENEDASTTGSKSNRVASTTTPAKTPSSSQSKSVFGFAKTASSMHFGHAAGRLGLQSSVSSISDITGATTFVLFCLVRKMASTFISSDADWTKTRSDYTPSRNIASGDIITCKDDNVIYWIDTSLSLVFSLQHSI